MSRVLIAGFCAVPGPDRAGVQMRHVLRALSPANSVDILCARHGDQPYVERLGNARILRVPLHEPDPRAQVEAFRRAMRRQLEGAEYDAVHVRDGWAGIPVLEARDRLRYAVVFDATRAPMAEPRARAAELEAELMRDEDALVLAADLVLAPHEPARRYIAARGRAERVVIVRPGVDVDQFDYDEPDLGGPPRILYLGGLAPGRGVRVLLRGMVDVARRTRARLAIAGPSAPGFERSLMAAASDLGIGDRVELLGRIDHERVPALIASAQVCVAPSAADLAPHPTALYPTKLLEYMACRRAVVAPRRGTVALLAKEGVHAAMFTPGDPGSLATVLTQLVEDPARREALADAGYQLVRASFTASGTRRQLRAAYRALARDPRFASRMAAEPITGPHIRTSAVPLPVAEEDNVTTELSDGDLLGAPAGGEVETEIDRQGLSDDHTRVDIGWIDARTDVGVSSDQWVVEETGTRRAVPPWAEVDDDGTPVDVRAAPQTTPPIESRFVAGEVDVPTPPPEPWPEDGSFTAVSVLLGSTPAPEIRTEPHAAVAPVDEDAPTPTPVRRPGIPPHLRGDDRNG